MANETFKNPLSETEAATRRCSVKKVILKNFAKFTGKHLCVGVSFSNKVAGQAFFSPVASSLDFQHFISHDSFQETLSTASSGGPSFN